MNLDAPLKIGTAYDKASMASINKSVTTESYDASNIMLLNKAKTGNQNSGNPNIGNSGIPHTVSSPSNQSQQSNSGSNTFFPVPPLANTVQKGQKKTLLKQANAPSIKCLFGWNASSSECDLDVSSFLLDESGKVIGDDWFVFYGQPNSPDNNLRFSVINNVDREQIDINLSQLNGSVKKIVFVLTINDAFPKHLNFSMVSDAYIRIIDSSNNQTLVSFMVTDYYSNVISTMIGEVYRHNDEWKFNAIGNGVAKDLAGLCELYGVQTED